MSSRVSGYFCISNFNLYTLTKWLTGKNELEVQKQICIIRKQRTKMKIKKEKEKASANGKIIVVMPERNEIKEESAANMIFADQVKMSIFNKRPGSKRRVKRRIHS